MFTRVRTLLEELPPRGLWLGPLILAGCSMEFSGQQQDFALSESTVEILHSTPEGQERLLAELERLFGVASAPGLPESAASLRSLGSLETAPFDVSAQDAEAIREGNRARFEQELAAIESGEAGSLGPWKWAPGLTESWEALVAEELAGPAHMERARQLFTEYYPSLRDSAALYGNKCLHCHGNEGGGDGPTSYTARPIPRDFRLGIFKYDNLEDGGRPERQDLIEIIRTGIEGTAMPSMATLSAAQLHGLADYVRLLAMRGEVELRLTMAHEDGEEPQRSEIDSQFEDVVSLWRDAPRERIDAPTTIPEPTAARITRGHQLFHDSSTVSCASCHGVGGLGGGPAAYGQAEDDADELVALLSDSWGHPARPTAITSATLRHGETPGQLYERLYLGIDGTPMAGIGGIDDGNGGLIFDDEDIWSLVHYVRALRDPQWNALLQELQTEVQ